MISHAFCCCLALLLLLLLPAPCFDCCSCASLLMDEAVAVSSPALHLPSTLSGRAMGLWDGWQVGGWCTLGTTRDTITAGCCSTSSRLAEHCVYCLAWDCVYCRARDCFYCLLLPNPIQLFVVHRLHRSS